MTATLEHPLEKTPSAAPERATQQGLPLPLAIAAVASLVAGVMHVGAIAAHSEHRQAVWAFLAVAVAQLLWGAFALAKPRRRVAAAGLVIGLASVAGWAFAKTRGIPFVDGLDDKEPIRFADALAAGLAMVTVIVTLAALTVRRLVLPRLLTAIACVALIAMVVPATSMAMTHDHGTSAPTTEPAPAVPPHPFDPALPIDLGGVPGVSPEQQARAENLLAISVLRLPQWSDPAYATAHGFVSIGDGVSGVEHYVSPEYMADDTILDPDKPESLVFDTTVTPKKLVAAMYMMTPGSTLADVPDIGGPLTQWHIHSNLCFNEQGRVSGLTKADGSCAGGLVKGPETPMMHVWIEPHPCGPFAALEGIGGGQIAAGETVACDHVHGS